MSRNPYVQARTLGFLATSCLTLLAIATVLQQFLISRKYFSSTCQYPFPPVHTDGNPSPIHPTARTQGIESGGLLKGLAPTKEAIPPRSAQSSSRFFRPVAKEVKFPDRHSPAIVLPRPISGLLPELGLLGIRLVPVLLPQNPSQAFQILIK